MYGVAGNPEDQGGFSDKQLLETPRKQLYQRLAGFGSATQGRVKKRLRLLKKRRESRRASANRCLDAAKFVEMSADLQSRADVLAAENAALHEEGDVIMQNEKRARQELMEHNQVIQAMKWQLGQLVMILAGSAPRALA
jgi:hypothetical protein